MKNTNIIKRGRPAKTNQVIDFNPSDIQLFRGSDLSFSEDLFKPHKTNREIDIILSTEGGLMPGTNMVLVGGPGSGKSTVALDMLADFTRQGLKCLFVSGEMDEIAHYKYCKRLPKFACVQTLFLKNYASTIKDTLEYVFAQGYDEEDVYDFLSWFDGIKGYDKKIFIAGNHDRYFQNHPDKVMAILMEETSLPS